MKDQCPHCGSSLPDYWWERNVPQFKWTAEQAAASSQRQQAELRYREFMDAAYKAERAGHQEGA